MSIPSNWILFRIVNTCITNLFGWNLNDHFLNKETWANLDKFNQLLKLYKQTLFFVW